MKPVTVEIPFVYVLEVQLESRSEDEGTATGPSFTYGVCKRVQDILCIQREVYGGCDHDVVKRFKGMLIILSSF